MPGSSMPTAVALMTAFAERTGLASPAPQRRYLWTDAFAVCTFLGIARKTGDQQHEELALRLVDRVHHVLGRHRRDDERTGWISGLDEAQGEANPTCGGLRIGKPLPERRPMEPLDERLEWDRDGQYFHYLTKWMHALDQVTRSTGQPVFHRWARELARAAHRGFTYSAGGGRRAMYWKMSIDLSRPLVESMGQHDPLDGFVTCLQLESTRASPPSLAETAADLASMVDLRRLATSDPLGIGGLLLDGYRVQELARREVVPEASRLFESLLAAALFGLRMYVEQGHLRAPAARRLAFRELGLAIGLASVAYLDEGGPAAGPGSRSVRAELERYAPLRAEIESFWLRPENRDAALWREHADINDVMLATSLEPEGFVVLRPPRPAA
jgi:hypothetical protein